MSNIEKKGFEFLSWIVNSEDIKTLIVTLLLLLAIFRTSFRLAVTYLSAYLKLGEIEFNTFDSVILISIPFMLTYLIILFIKSNKNF